MNLDSTKEPCLARELSLNGISFQWQHPQPAEHQGIQHDCGYRSDMLIEEELLIERKAGEAIKRMHEAPLPRDLKLAGIKAGLLNNFNVTKLKDGIKSSVL